MVVTVVLRRLTRLGQRQAPPVWNGAAVTATKRSIADRRIAITTTRIAATISWDSAPFSPKVGELINVVPPFPQLKNAKRPEMANPNESISASSGAMPQSRLPISAMLIAVLNLVFVFSVHAILAGDENASPADSPANRLDTLGAASPFNAVGSLAISAGGYSYIGSATAISPDWVLTAGHNLDLNDTGTPTTGLSVNFNLPGFGTYAASGFYTCPGFTGFGNPSIQRDLGLIHLATPLPAGVLYPSLNGSLSVGTTLLLLGYGRSGYGNYGYTTAATLTDRRTGYNVVNSLQPDDGGAGYNALFSYDFSSPATAGQPGSSLGNNLESIIGPGDSGGPALVADGSGYAIAGVNTFVEGYGGQFGDIGGGVVLAPYVGWIDSTMVVPEPSAVALIILGLTIILFWSTRWLRRGIKN